MGPDPGAGQYRRQHQRWLFGLGLPAGEITGALSAEMRWRTYDMKTNALPTDFVNCTGLRLCTHNGGAAPSLYTQNTNAPVSVDDNVWETALEFNVPILKDMPLAQDLSADIAGRYTNYSISGDAETWKIGVNDKINETVRLRGTMSFDIRAPNLNDLYAPVSITSTGFNDLLTNVNSGTQLVTKGNAGLTPEVAHTYTLGIVLTPDFIPGLTTSLDYYQTHMSNAITSISYQSTTVQNLCIKASRATIRLTACSPPGRSRRAGPGYTIDGEFSDPDPQFASEQRQHPDGRLELRGGLHLRLGRCVERHTGLGDLAASDDLSAGAGDAEPARHGLCLDLPAQDPHDQLHQLHRWATGAWISRTSGCPA